MPPAWDPSPLRCAGPIGLTKSGLRQRYESCQAETRHCIAAPEEAATKQQQQQRVALNKTERAVQRHYREAVAAVTPLELQRLAVRDGSEGGYGPTRAHADETAARAADGTSDANEGYATSANPEASAALSLSEAVTAAVVRSFPKLAPPMALQLEELSASFVDAAMCEELAGAGSASQWPLLTHGQWEGDEASHRVMERFSAAAARLCQSDVDGSARTKEGGKKAVRVKGGGISNTLFALGKACLAKTILLSHDPCAMAAGTMRVLSCVCRSSPPTHDHHSSSRLLGSLVLSSLVFSGERPPSHA